VEQGNITPPNGWKAYYAATRAIMNVNTDFYNIIREGSLPAMSRFWLNADYVKCIYATGEFFTGYVLNISVIEMSVSSLCLWSLFLFYFGSLHMLNHEWYSFFKLERIHTYCFSTFDDVCNTLALLRYE
jgi:hypothetical protein